MTATPRSDRPAPPDELRALRDEFTRFLLHYRFGMDEVVTKMSILRSEFRHVHAYNPIEHVASRLKTPESVLLKAERRGCRLDLDSIGREITDIAGVRVVCAFESDVYRVAEMFTGQSDVKLLRTKDYIAQPKANGYRSLHAIVEIPVYLSHGAVEVPVEVQFRTVAMHFWASLEHKIYYKYDRHVPEELLAGLHEAALTAARLDADMERLHIEIRGVPGRETAETGEALERPIEFSEHAMDILRRFITL